MSLKKSNEIVNNPQPLTESDIYEIKYSLKLDKVENFLFNNVEDLKSYERGLVGDIVFTSGYNSPGDGGGGKYMIKSSYGLKDNYGLGFDLANSLVAVLISDVKNVEHFGIFPDGITNWERDHYYRMDKMYEAAQYFTINFNRGLYFTGINLYNSLKDIKFNFNNTELGGILHVISNGKPITGLKVLQLVDEGNTIYVQTESLNATQNRTIIFYRTGTSLDGKEFMTNIVSSNELRINKDSFSGTLSNQGYIVDKPLKNTTLTGKLTTYDRLGTINAHGVYGGLNLICKEDIYKNVNGDGGRGVHIYNGCKNFELGYVIIDGYENQNKAQNNLGAFSVDGYNPINPEAVPENIFVNRIEINDTTSNGVFFQGKNHRVNNIIVNRFGSNISNPLSKYYTRSRFAITGEKLTDIHCGVILHGTNVDIGTINVIQQDGFTNRSKALIDVFVGRSFFDADGTTYSFPTINKILSQNPQREVLSVGLDDYQTGVNVKQIDIEEIPDDNILILSNTERDLRGLIDVYVANVNIGQIHCTNNKEATIVQQLDNGYNNSQKQYMNLKVDSIFTRSIPAQGKIFNCNINAICLMISAFGQGQNKSSFFTEELILPKLASSKRAVLTDSSGKLIQDEKRIGTTADRPTNKVSTGFQYFDVTIARPIYRWSAGWIDSQGNSV